MSIFLTSNTLSLARLNSWSAAERGDKRGMIGVIIERDDGVMIRGGMIGGMSQCEGGDRVWLEGMNQ